VEGRILDGGQGRDVGKGRFWKLGGRESDSVERQGANMSGRQGALVQVKKILKTG
jgi:hypothetical protein